MPEGTCRRCDAPLPSQAGRGGRYQFCSPACREADRTEAKTARIAAERANLRCLQCLTPLSTSTRSRARKFCSKWCSEAFRGARLPQPLPRKVCALVDCGATFQPKSHKQECCCEDHGKRFWVVKNPNRRHPVICVLCGSSAVSTSPTARFCSHDCSVLWLMENPELDYKTKPRRPRSTSMELVHLGSLAEVPNPREMVIRHCRYCADEFTVEQRSPRLYCTANCRTAYVKYGRSREHDDGRNWRLFICGACEWCHRQFVATACSVDAPTRYCSGGCRGAAGKARRGEFVIPYDVRQFIYDRDGWICQLCGDDVDPTLASSNIWAATLDHIVCQSWTDEPDHSPENLRLAHRWCNSVRGDERYYSADILTNT